ncbi:M12 family metallo-peptidase [Aquimarina sp. MMG016]|uniref:M12 family metallo-peptidase n=1 Tax=Aquimarina sp. MMG016 TaxID=2822690 RepID=UPI001B3A356A|nr:M12 family metallo-peptidase [Aquimarina sp. MMG016]MBQ4819161.1 T9SS type A sorting domain-containing protein [Aquimarina sp. MMG016]
MKNILTMLIAFFSVISYAQTQSLKPSQRVQQEKAFGETFESFQLFTAVDHQKAALQVPSELKDYTVFSFDTQKLSSFKSKVPTTMELQIPNQKSAISLELVKVDVTTDDFEIREMPSGKIVPRDASVLHYRGIIKGQPNSLAAISFFGNEISGIISAENQSNNMVVGKLKNSDHQILYQDKDIGHLNDFVCQMIDNPKIEYTEEQLRDNGPNKAAVKCPRIFFDIANDIVRDKGGAQAATNYIEAIFNQVSVLYANDDISIRMSGANAWTSNAPFNGLNNYRSYRNQNSFNGDLGHFVTYDFSGGVAWVNSACSSYKYAVSGIRRSFSNVPTYSWSVEVVAHELGHNLGSQHTQACVWNGNNTAIDGCYQTEGGCARPGLPSGGGTIMSYCHLTNVGINFNKGFGSQPRNVIRNAISSKSCFQTCDVGGCSNGDNVNVTIVNDTDCTLNYFLSNSSEVVTINAGQSLQRNAIVGATWEARDPNNDAYDTFQIVCNQSTYTTDGSCATGGNPCEGVSPWQSGVSYPVGALVTYQGNLYRRTSSGWDNLGPCPTTADPCEGVSEWQSGVNYPVGSLVTYQGNLYRRTSSGWDNLGPCGANINALPSDGSSLPVAIVVYPNPVKDILNIKINNVSDLSSKVSIKDINGKTLRTVDVNSSPEGNVEQILDVSSFSAGVYFVQIINAKKVITQKIFIE